MSETQNNSLQNVNIESIKSLIKPKEIREAHAPSDKAVETVLQGRKDIENILDGKDQRFLAVIGPCSIHDTKAAFDYAEKLAALSEKVKDRICIIMRVYFEKPRTTVGWKGLINDPNMDDTFDIETGLKTAREVLLKINEMGLPTGTEMLDPITPQFISDLVSWASIGARTTESQTHRQMASGLSMPVGFKNATDGTVQIALDAMVSARSPHSFVGIDADGLTSIVKTRGNHATHLILRGGRKKTNYDFESVKEASEKLLKSDLNTRLVVDCSHGNSEKDHTKQEGVWNYVVEQAAKGNEAVVGAMVESNLKPGNQKLKDPNNLEYGVSITDACIGREDTERIVLEAYEKLANIHASA